MPLAEALDIVQQQCSHNRLQEVLADVQARVRAGKALSEALAGFPEVFDAFYIHLITVGEEVGSLGAVLRRIAEYLERTRALKRTVQLALVYPFIILAVAAGAIGFMLTVIVPTFAEMFEGFGAELPGATKRLIAISSFMSGNVLWLLGGGVALGLAVKWGLQTRWGRSWWDYGVLRLPFIGGMLRKGLAARFCRALHTLLQRGVPLLASLELLTGALGNVHAKAEVRQMRHAVEQGRSLAGGMQQAEVFPPLVQQMVGIGEATARLGDTCRHVATLYEDELDAQMETLTSIIEPVLIVVIGGIIGAIVIALYLPLFDLITVVE